MRDGTSRFEGNSFAEDLLPFPPRVSVEPLGLTIAGLGGMVEASRAAPATGPIARLSRLRESGVAATTAGPPEMQRSRGSSSRRRWPDHRRASTWPGTRWPAVRSQTTQRHRAEGLPALEHPDQIARVAVRCCPTAGGGLLHDPDRQRRTCPRPSITRQIPAVMCAKAGRTSTTRSSTATVMPRVSR